MVGKSKTFKSTKNDVNLQLRKNIPLSLKNESDLKKNRPFSCATSSFSLLHILFVRLKNRQLVYWMFRVDKMFPTTSPQKYQMTFRTLIATIKTHWPNSDTTQMRTSLPSHFCVDTRLIVSSFFIFLITVVYRKNL